MARYTLNRGTQDDWLEQLNLQKLIPIVLVGLPVVFVLVGILTCFFTVAPEGEAVVKRFGAVHVVRGPGLHFKLPFWIDRHTFVPTRRVLKEEFGFITAQAAQRSTYQRPVEVAPETLMLTGDLNVIVVEWVVQYRISDPDEYIHNVRNPTETIRVIAESVMRRIVGNRLGSDVLTVGRVEISAQAATQMQQVLNSYDMGVHITSVELKGVTPPKQVKQAYNEVNMARQEREQFINEAERQRNQLIPRAEGEARKVIAQAEGYAAERVNQAEGESSRFTAIFQEYHQAPDITRQHLYLKMIDRIMPNVGRVYVVEKGQTTPIPLLNLESGRTTPSSGRPRP